MNRKPRIKDGVRVREEAFGALVFTNRTPILSFNSDSFMIWKEITGTKTVEEICSAIGHHFGTDEHHIEMVLNFLSACEDLDLITFR